jgi:hypothetical protein
MKDIENGMKLFLMDEKVNSRHDTGGGEEYKNMFL